MGRGQRESCCRTDDCDLGAEVAVKVTYLWDIRFVIMYMYLCVYIYDYICVCVAKTAQDFLGPPVVTKRQLFFKYQQPSQLLL